MQKSTRAVAGFTLIELIISVAIFALFALGVYGALQMVYKAVYKSRTIVLETALLDEQLEIIRNLPFNSVGILNGLPAGVIPHTATITRNGVPFLVTTAVRNIDDPFDGVLGGSPNDMAPADYKLVELTVQCQSCDRPTATTVSTVVPPKDLEGSTSNGAIFIHVTDSHSNPVAGADVHLVNTSTVPNIFIDDVTDQDGYLRIVDTPTGTMSYAVSVSKPGFSTDATVVSSTGNPTPTNPPLTVMAQTVTDVYFFIDWLSSATIHTVTESCDPVPASFTMTGKTKVGNPDVRRYSVNLSTGADGTRDLSEMTYDTYNFTMLGNSYDLAGTDPMTPFDLKAGSHSDVSLVLAPHTANSLLVNVADSGNKQPVAGATVVLKKGAYQSILETNFGTISQTDWSGGPSTTQFFDAEAPNAYASGSDLNVDPFTAPGNILLTKLGPSYLTQGEIKSLTFDLGRPVDLKTVTFSSEAEHPETGPDSILLQLAVSNSSSPATLTNFVGPDGTAASFYTSTSTIVNTGGQPFRYVRYRVILSTEDPDYSPVFSDFALTFTNGCIPPGQVFFRGLSAGTYELQASAAGYDSTSSTISINGRTTSTITLYKSP